MALDRARLKELVVYICRQCRDPDKLGKTKLHKVIWFAEAQALRRTAKLITGVEFIKNEHGPFVPLLDDIVAELQREGRLYVRTVPFHDYEKTEYIAKSDANMAGVDEKHISSIDAAITSVCEDHTAASISERSHRDIWNMAAMYEPLPIETALVANLLPITEEDKTWAREELARMTR